MRVKVPSSVPRLIPVGGAHTRFLLAEDLIIANVKSLFPGASPGECYPFRVTRDADIDLRENEAQDLLRVVQQQLSKRRFGTPVRLEVSAAMPEDMVDYLRESLGLAVDDIYSFEGPLSPQDLMSLYDLDRPDLKEEPFEPRVPECYSSDTSIFEVIKQRDVLLHHPFDSYDCITDFVEASVNDPDVVAIKICLYRTGPDSPIPPA